MSPRGVRATVILLAGAGLALLVAFQNELTAALPPCPLHALTGLHCPFCGGTRALRALLHGDLPAALAWNALLPLSLFAALWLTWRTQWSAASLRWSLTILVAFGLLRNLPLPVFHWLAPHPW